jgi:hypothetical protein
MHCLHACHEENAAHCCCPGCQMAYFQTKNPNLGKFWRVLQWKMLKYFMVKWSILWPFGILSSHLVYIMAIWYIFPSFGMLYHEKSGNPGCCCRSSSPTKEKSLRSPLQSEKGPLWDRSRKSKLQLFLGLEL